MKNIIVTGSNGFVGKSLINKLKETYSVFGFDDEYLYESNWKTLLLSKLESIKPDVIFHVGACSDTLVTDVNYMMIRNYESTKIIMDWCVEKHIPMIYSSSAANYGINGYHPSNLYGWSKYVAEDYVISKGGVALRYFNVYGPGEEHKNKMSSIAYQMYIKKKLNEPIFLFPKKPKRDFVFIDDVVSANIFSFENYNKIKGKYYEVGSGEANTFEDVLTFMEIDFEYVDEDKIPYGYQFYTRSENEKWIPNWKPKWSLEKGIKNYKKYLDERN